MNISFSDVVNNTISEHWRVDLPPTLNRIQVKSNNFFPGDGMDGVGTNATERCEYREVYSKNDLEPILKVASSKKERAHLCHIQGRIVGITNSIQGRRQSHTPVL